MPARKMFAGFSGFEGFRPNLKAAGLWAELEGVGQGEQQTRAAARIVRRAVAQWKGHRDIGLQIAAQKEPHAGACRGQRKAIIVAESVVPGSTRVDETIELIAGQVTEVQTPIEAQFKRAGDAVVAADLGAAIAAPEGGGPEIELLRGEQRTGSDLAGGGNLHRPCIGQRLIAGEPGIHHGEIGRGAVTRQKIVAEMRSTEDIETLTIRQREVIVAAEMVLQPVIGSQADGADVVAVDRADHVALGDIAETG